MPMIDIPVTPVSAAEVVIERRVGEAGDRGLSPVSAVSARRAVGICRLTENHPGDISGQVSLSFPAAALNYLSKYENRHMRELESSAMVTQIQQPEHGSLLSRQLGSYLYTPEPGYFGKDSVVAEVEVGGYHVRVTYFIQVIKENIGDGNDIETIRKYCRSSSRMWKMSWSNWGQTPIDLLANHNGVLDARKMS